MWLTETQQGYFLERVVDLVPEYDYICVSFCTNGPRPSGRGTYDIWHNSRTDCPKLVGKDSLTADQFAKMVDVLGKRLESMHPDRTVIMARAEGVIREIQGSQEEWITDQLVFWSRNHGFSVPDWIYLDQFSQKTRRSTIRHLSSFPRY